MSHGILPVLTGALAATGFYFGAGIVTIAAAGAKEPAVAVSRATQSAISRVPSFYFGSIVPVAAIFPRNSKGIVTPYFSALAAIRLPDTAHVMKAMILTAALSALNSGLYASSRILFPLTRNGDAPLGARAGQS